MREPTPKEASSAGGRGDVLEWDASTHLENQINESKEVSVALGDWEGATRSRFRQIAGPEEEDLADAPWYDGGPLSADKPRKNGRAVSR